jgi:hypothetical protein
MAFFWVKFRDREPGTVQGDGSPYPSDGELEAATADATARAAKHGAVLSLQVLPYPAEPRIDVRSDCPSFCYTPEQCVGRTCCPGRYSCTE